MPIAATTWSLMALSGAIAVSASLSSCARESAKTTMISETFYHDVERSSESLVFNLSGQVVHRRSDVTLGKWKTLNVGTYEFCGTSMAKLKFDKVSHSKEVLLSTSGKRPSFEWVEGTNNETRP